MNSKGDEILLSQCERLKIYLILQIVYMNGVYSKLNEKSSAVTLRLV